MCENLRIRSKKYKKYFYCTYLKKEITKEKCTNCTSKQYKARKPIKTKRKTDKRYSVIVTDFNKCFICGKTFNIEKHEIFHGSGNRKLSIKYGLVVGLCHDCHNEPPFGVHHNYFTDIKLKQIGQKKFNECYPNEDFFQIFKINYL